MKNLIKAFFAMFATLLLLACGMSDMDATSNKLSTTGISPYTTSAGFGKPASAQEIAAMIPKIDSYFSGQYASNPKALMGEQTTAIAQVATTAVAKPVFRFYNSNTSAHFYTMSESERDYIKQTFPFFSYEGEQFYAYPDVDPVLSPVYRFYNHITATHFYTINTAEKDHVIATWPQIFNYEGIAWHASKAGGVGWIPVYRFFNHRTGTHFYTANGAEKDHIIATWDWFRFEGIAYYAESATYTGKVIDGYIRGATVFWDCNDNLKFDSTEIKTTSGFAGSYSIGAKPNANCVLRAIVPATAIDEDTNKPIGTPMVLSSIPGKPQLISPLTTPVGIGAMTEVDVLALLNGTTLSLTDDYIAAGSAGVQNHNAARYVAATLKAISGQISTDDQEVRANLLSNALTQLPQSAWTTKTPLAQVTFDTYFTDNSGLGLIDPFAAFLTKQSFMLDQDAILALPVSQRVAAQAAVQKALDAINSRPDMVAGGVIVWGALPQTVRSTFAPTLADTNIFPETTEVSQLRAVLFDEAAKARVKIKAAENESRQKQFAQLLKSGTDATLTSLNTATTVVAPATRKMIKKAKITQAPKWLKTKIAVSKNLRKYTTVANDHINCASFFTRLPNLLDSMEGSVSFLVEDMIPWGLEGVTCINALAGSEKMEKALKVVSGVSDIAAGTISFADAKEYVQFQSALNDIALAILDMASLDVPRAILAEWDLFFIKSVTMAIEQNETADAADAAMQIIFDKVSSEFNLFADEMRDKLLSARLMPYIRPIATECDVGYFLSNGRCLENSTVSNITPVTATLNTATIFTVTGTNLPLTALLAVADATCQSPVNNTVTGFSQTCTPTVAGVKSITVKTASGGAVIDNTRSVSVGAFTNNAQLPGTWTGWDGTKYTSAEVVQAAGYITKATSNWANLRYRLNSPINGDDFRVTFRAKNDPNLGGVNYRDLGFSLGNDFSTGLYDASGAEKRTREVVFLTRNGYSNDFFIVNSSTTNSGFLYQNGVLSNITWNTYSLNVKNNIVSLYYDGILKYSQIFSGSLGLLDTFAIEGLANVQIDPASLVFASGVVSSGTFSAPANLEAGTLFTAPAGASSCVFSAAGTWSLESGLSYSADGFGPNTSVPGILMYPGSGAALVAYKNGGYIHIGSSRTVSISGGEQMRFMANDYTGAFGDNSGALSISYSCN